MVQFIASTGEIEDQLVRLHDLVQSGGGKIHPDVRLCERGGDFTIEAPASISSRQPLIEVPGSLLLPVAWFDLGLAGGELQIGSADARVSLLQTELMETLVALYNATGKVKQHREISTFSIHQTDFELFSKLAFPDQIRARETAPEEDNLLRDFLQTRVLAVPEAALEGRDDGPASQSVNVLMPVIDFLNHDPRAGGYNLVDGVLTAVRGNPAAGSDECFICYGRHDAQSLLLTYGYLHRELPFAFSKPMTLDVHFNGATIGMLAIFRSGAPMRAGNIPATFQGDGWIMPALSGNPAENLVQAAYLPIIADGPVPLTRRLLELIVSVFVGEAAPVRGVAQEAARLEREIVAANIDHYLALKATILSRERAPEAAYSFETAAHMIDKQLSILHNYAQIQLR